MKPYYVAPEVIAGDYTEKCDIWSCGVILFMLLSGRAPFNGTTDEEILEKVATGVYEMNPRRWGHISKEAKDLVCKMLEVNVEKRMSAADALKHPWFDAMAKLKEENIRPEAFNETLQNLKSYRVSILSRICLPNYVRLEENCNKPYGSSLCSTSLVKKSMKSYYQYLENLTKMETAKSP